MPKEPGLLDEYVAEVEARYGDDFKSNRTLVAELTNKERAQERRLFKEVACVISALRELWDQEEHGTLSQDEHKDVYFQPRLTMYPDGRRKFSCSVTITHIDFRFVTSGLPWSNQDKKRFVTFSFAEFPQVMASAHDVALPYVQSGYKPTMYSVRTVTPDIHFPGYCPSPIPAYVSSLRKYYSDPPVYAFPQSTVSDDLIEVQISRPLPDEPDFILPTYLLKNNVTMYDITTVLHAFHPLLGLHLEKVLSNGIAILERDVYALAWLGITPLAREMTRLNTQSRYYGEEQ